MTDYPLEPGQRMIVRPNGFKAFTDLGHKVLCLGEIVSTKKGIIAKDCSYSVDNHPHYISIPLFLLWRIADDENLLEYYESEQLGRTEAT